MSTNEDTWPEPPQGARLLTRYQRRLRSSVDGVWRNVLDFEHLPWVHGHSFAAIEPLARGRDWWRAEVTVAPASLNKTMVLELRVDRDRLRYVTRTLAGVGAGGYILTTLAPASEDAGEPRTDIEVEFWGQARSEGAAKLKARAYMELYTRLWDEDEAMIVDMLAADGHTPWRPRGGERLRVLGPRALEGGGRRLGLIEHQGQHYAHDLVCPHMGGPLADAKLDEQGRLRCPWHDYRFGLDGGSCAGRPALGLACARVRRLDEEYVEVEGD